MSRPKPRTDPGDAAPLDFVISDAAQQVRQQKGIHADSATLLFTTLCNLCEIRFMSNSRKTSLIFWELRGNGITHWHRFVSEQEMPLRKETWLGWWFLIQSQPSPPWSLPQEFRELQDTRPDSGSPRSSRVVSHKVLAPTLGFPAIALAVLRDPPPTAACAPFTPRQVSRCSLRCLLPTHR